MVKPSRPKRPTMISPATSGDLAAEYPIVEDETRVIEIEAVRLSIPKVKRRRAIGWWLFSVAAGGLLISASLDGLTDAKKEPRRPAVVATGATAESIGTSVASAIPSPSRTGTPFPSVTPSPRPDVTVTITKTVRATVTVTKTVTVTATPEPPAG